MVKIFSVNEEVEKALQERKNHQGKIDTTSFEEAIGIVKEHFDNFFKDENIDNAKKQERLDLTHKAVIGDKDTENFLVNEIDHFLRENNITNISYPKYYNSLPHAIFHEIYRFGVLHKWYSMHDSPAAKFTGQEFWIEKNDEFELQEERLTSEQTVFEFIQRFQAGKKNLKINESNPYDEIALNDTTRVTIIVPPANFLPTIVFRKYTVGNISFEKQAEYETIPFEDVNFYKVMSNLFLNVIVAGHIKSGKSTFLKTIYGARDSKKVAVLIEGTPETFLKRDFPDRLVHELYSEGQDINKIMSRALRLDHDYIIVQEVRAPEAEGAISGTERGRTGLLMSYHITDPENTARQLAQHIVDYYPNRHQRNEIRRIAKQLDLGVTMASHKGKKRITSMYEIGIDEKTNEAFVNYLIYFNESKDKWEYNSKVSQQLIKKMNKINPILSAEFIRHLELREKTSPMSIDPMHEVTAGETW